MSEKIIINKTIAKHTTLTRGFRPSKSGLSGTLKKDGNLIGSSKKPRKRRRAQAFG